MYSLYHQARRPTPFLRVAGGSFNSARTKATHRLLNLFPCTSQRCFFTWCLSNQARFRLNTRSHIQLAILSPSKSLHSTGPASNKSSKDGDKQTSKTTSPIDQRAAKEILKQLSSPPNILTLSRIMATPYLSYLLVSHHHEKMSLVNIAEEVDSTITDAAANVATNALTNIDLTSTPTIAFSLFLVMSFTDFLDGYTARRFNYSTVLGTYLDPFADKMLIGVMSITLWYTEALPAALVGLWVVRDIGMFSTAYWMVRTETLKRSMNNKDSGKSESIVIMNPTNTPLKVEANFLSKVNTTLQIGLIALGIAGEVPSINIPSELMTGLW